MTVDPILTNDSYLGLHQNSGTFMAARGEILVTCRDLGVWHSSKIQMQNLRTSGDGFR